MYFSPLGSPPVFSARILSFEHEGILIEGSLHHLESLNLLGLG